MKREMRWATTTDDEGKLHKFRADMIKKIIFHVELI